MCFIFWLFASLLIVSAVILVLSRNPVHSILFLIFVFVNAAGLLLLLGAELVAMLLIIVYVGAVVVLFLFVVMMLGVELNPASRLVPRNLPILILLVSMLGLDIYALTRSKELSEGGILIWQKGNATTIGKVMYTDYFYPFQIVGVLLLAAMVGAISLTLGMNPVSGSRAKVQSPFDQMVRSSKIKMVDLR